MGLKTDQFIYFLKYLLDNPFVEIILGSSSPRRGEILNFFKIPFKQISSNFDEECVPFNGQPASFVEFLAQAKAEALVPFFPDQMILTADTIVFRDNKIFGKPKNREEAMQNLMELSGKSHSVFTGLAIYAHKKIFLTNEETKVYFNSLTKDQMHAYLDKIPVYDKAAGYMIQASGSLIVKRIEGCYYNVMGLPINGLCKILKDAGINLWDYI